MDHVRAAVVAAGAAAACQVAPVRAVPYRQPGRTVVQSPAADALAVLGAGPDDHGARAELPARECPQHRYGQVLGRRLLRDLHITFRNRKARAIYGPLTRHTPRVSTRSAWGCIT